MNAVSSGNQTPLVQPMALVTEMTALSRIKFFSIRIFFEDLEISSELRFRIWLPDENILPRSREGEPHV
jgi:hypothetical protein